jgi:hypothetical protein
MKEIPAPLVKRSVLLSDGAWASISERAALESKSAAALCVYLLEAYVDLEEKPVYELPPGVAKRVRTLMAPVWLWARLRALKIQQRRSISDILEQLIRAYTGLALEKRLD